VIRVPGYRSSGPGFDSRRYHIFREVVGLKRGPVSLVSTIELLLGRNSSGSGLENREYGRRDPLRWPRVTLCPQKLALTSPTIGGRSVGIVRLRTKATEFVLFCCSQESFDTKTGKTSQYLRITGVYMLVVCRLNSMQTLIVPIHKISDLRRFAMAPLSDLLCPRVYVMYRIFLQERRGLL
jgi:hypothetical protein